MENVTIDLKGFRELDEALKQMPQNLARRVLVNGLRASGAVLVRGIKARAPVRATGKQKKLGKSGKPQPRGFLRRSIKASKPFADQAGKMSIRISVGNAFYGRFLELGTRRMPKRPFFRPGIEGVMMAAFDRLREVVAQGIARAGRR